MMNRLVLVFGVATVVALVVVVAGIVRGLALRMVDVEAEMFGNP